MRLSLLSPTLAPAPTDLMQRILAGLRGLGQVDKDRTGLGHHVASYLLGSLLLLLLLLLGVISFFLYWGFLNWRRCLFNLLLLLLDGNEESDNLLGLDHVVFINLKLTEDVINLSLGHLVAPCHQSVLEHLGVNLAVHVVGLESLDDEVVGVVSVAGHLLLEHLDHVLVGAGTTNLTKKTVELRLGHEDTNVVESSTEIIFVQGTVLVDVHQLEAVLVHLELLLGESSFILALAHFALSVSKSK